MDMMLEKVEMFGWKNCFKLSSGELEIIATADVGPRIIYFGKKGGRNLLKIFEDEAGRTGDKEYHIYGGHRVWAAPEDPVLSYIPDNDPVEFNIDENKRSISLKPADDGSGLGKSMELRVDTNGGFVIRNKIVNVSGDFVDIASWGITAFVPGGVGIMPLVRETEKELQLRSDFSLNLWHYTDLSDPAFEWHKNAIVLHQSKCLAPQKIGCYLEKPVLAYKLGEDLIIKKMINSYKSGKGYPDRGSNAEIYLNTELLELEFLSEWKTLAPGESVYHEEELSLIKIDDEEEISSAIDKVMEISV